MSIIVAQDLSKVYPVAIKEPGFQGTIRHFFSRTYRTIKAVQGVSFQIEPGEVVGFLGANGAGKTTTLKMLTGLIHPSTGMVRVCDRVPFRRESDFLQKITLVMGQKQQLIWDLPVLDSLKINGAVYDISDGDYRRRVGELTEMLSLEGKLNQPVRKLSLGERMKAELMAALLHRPEVLFLDEPTLGLDINAQFNVREFLREYNQRYQATILLTSHYMADITSLCPRVILIHEGLLVYDGSLEGLMDRFAPYREVQFELETPLTKEQVSVYGEVESIEGKSVRLLVKGDTLTATVAKILADWEVLDLKVSEPPIEEVIGRVFRTGVVS